MEPLFILEAARSPFASVGGELATVSADELARLASRHVMLRRPDVAANIREVIFGCARPEHANLAQIVATRSGLQRSVPALTVQRGCATGLEAIQQIARRSSTNRDDVFLVGGTESMSHYPLLMSDGLRAIHDTIRSTSKLTEQARALTRVRPSQLKPRVALNEGMIDPLSGSTKSATAEHLAREFNITRSNQDEFALASRKRAAHAAAQLRDECVLVLTADRAIEEDPLSTQDATLSDLSHLASMSEDGRGTVTSGNSAQPSDGAVAMLLTHDEGHSNVLGKIVHQVDVGVSAARAGLSALYAIAELVRTTNFELSDIDLFEIHENSAAEILACLVASSSQAFGQQELGRNNALGEISFQKLNVNGGALALGHPVGASGPRMVVSLLKELERRNLERGLVAMGDSDGHGSAMLVERSHG